MTAIVGSRYARRNPVAVLGTMPPNHAYYRACHGRWRCPLQMRITDAAALRGSGMSWSVRVGLRMMAAWPRWLGRFFFETSVRYDEDDAVTHTTVVRWLGLPLLWGTERIALDPDGRAFTIEGEHRLLTQPWRRLAARGAGTIGASADHAEYTLDWLGAPMTQTTTREHDRVTVTQQGRGWSAVQALDRHA
jgi:hypothetical protein